MRQNLVLPDFHSDKHGSSHFHRINGIIYLIISAQRRPGLFYIVSSHFKAGLLAIAIFICGDAPDPVCAVLIPVYGKHSAFKAVFLIQRLRFSVSAGYFLYGDSALLL